MHKSLLAFITAGFASFLGLQTQAQTVSCTDQPFQYIESEITYQNSGGISFGDYFLSIPIKNTTTSNYAYPQAKLVPTTPLPEGMVINPSGDVWIVFASSWNIDSTAPAQIFFDQNLPFEANASVTFELWMKNLAPLTIDSCKFDNTFTFNFNPQPNAIPALEAKYPKAFIKQGKLEFIYPDLVQSFQLFDLSGRLLANNKNSSSQLSLPLGAYLIVLKTAEGANYTQKIFGME
jgi:hypothetical protein